MSLRRFLVLISFLSVSVSSAVAFEVSFSNRSETRNLRTKERRTIEANTKTEFSSDPYWVSSADRAPALLIPVYQPQGDVSLDLPMIDDVLKNRAQAFVDEEMDGFLREYISFQNSIRAKNYKMASESLSRMRNDHPHVYFLKFLEASLLVLTGDMDSAKQRLVEGLKYHPDYQEGKNLLKKLGGTAP